MALSKTAAVELGAGREHADRPSSIDPALAGLLDHIAQELAREYVRLMERAAGEGSAGVLQEQDRREA